MTKNENIQMSIEMAEKKLKSIDSNISQLRAKIGGLEAQIAANEKKKEKIRFFLTKSQKTIQD